MVPGWWKLAGRFCGCNTGGDVIQSEGVIQRDLWEGVIQAMSTLITLRVPDDLLVKVDEVAKRKGQNRSQVIITILRETFEGESATASVPKVEKATARERERPKERELEQVKKVATGCPEHGQDCGYAKAGGWWCPKNGRVI